MTRFYYKMIVEYDGTEFSGWQIQPNKRTVQGILQDAIASYTRLPIKLVGAGRTDAGVHAVGQVCGFSTEARFEVSELKYRLNRILPDDIAVVDTRRARQGFNPRRNAISRTYRYSIGEGRRPLSRHAEYQILRQLEIGKLNEAAALFIGQHDFTAFCRRKSLRKENYCEIYESRWFRYGGRAVYEIQANRFLHHMVRRVVGVMLAVEASKIDLTQIEEFLNNKAAVKYNVPAKGLVLTAVKYGRMKR